MSNLKVEGKVADFCPKCKNCKSTTRECDGEKDWLTEVECEDPYDGMIKTLAADSDICCSMFEAKTGEKNNTKGIQECCCENIYFMPSQVNAMIDDVKRQKDIERNAAVNGLKIQIKQLELGYEELECKIKDLTDTNNKLMERNVELVAQCDEIYEKFRDCEKLKKENETGSKIVEENVNLEKETKRLKEANENLLEKCKVYIDEKADLKLNVENLQTNINFQKYLKDEAYKREDKLKKELNKVKAHDEALTKHFQNDEKLIDCIQKVIFPQGEGSDYTYSYEEILDKVKELKVQSDENGTMYEDLKYWKERCHNAETDVTTLNSKVGSLKNKIVSQQSTHYKQCARILELENMVSKLQSGEYDDILAKDIEIKSLQAKYEDAMAGWKGSMDTNDKLNQTISELTESNENLKKMVERRDRWVEEFKSDVYTLQNEILRIRNIAQKAYDDTNRD